MENAVDVGKKIEKYNPFPTEKCNRCQKNEKKLGYFPVKIFLPVLENVTDVGKNQGFA